MSKYREPLANITSATVNVPKVAMPNTKPIASIAINTTHAPKFTISIRSANTMNASAAKSPPDTKPCQGMFHFIDSILWQKLHNWTYLLVNSRWPILWF